MRRLLLTLSVAAALVAVAHPAAAQLKFGGQAAMMTGLDEATSLNGTFGIGPRVAFAPPLFPLGVIGQGVYYFPEGDGSYLTYSLAAQLRLPLPMISPYAIGGWQWRRSSGGGDSSTETGPMIGVGVELNLGVNLFLEGSLEFNDEVPSAPDFDVNPIVIKGGVLLGG
jgi:hypothetical protein